MLNIKQIPYNNLVQNVELLSIFIRLRTDVLTIRLFGQLKYKETI